MSISKAYRAIELRIFLNIFFKKCLLGELTINSVGITLEKEITRIENVRHANENLDSMTL